MTRQNAGTLIHRTARSRRASGGNIRSLPLISVDSYATEGRWLTTYSAYFCAPPSSGVVMIWTTRHFFTGNIFNVVPVALRRIPRLSIAH